MKAHIEESLAFGLGLGACMRHGTTGIPSLAVDVFAVDIRIVTLKRHASPSASKLVQCFFIVGLRSGESTEEGKPQRSHV